MSYPAQHPPQAIWSTSAGGERATFLSTLEWGAGLAFLLIMSGVWAAPLTGYQISANDSALLRNAFFPAYAALIFLIATRPARLLGGLLDDWILLGLVALAFASILWSIDPAGTLRRSLALAFTTLGGIMIARRWPVGGVTELYATMFAICGVGSLLLALAVPRWGIMNELFPGAWRGAFLEKNALGGMMSVGAVVQVAAAVYAPKRRFAWVVMAALSMALVLASQSKTSLVGLLLGLAALAACALGRRGPATAVLGLWLAVAASALVVSVMLLAPDVVLERLGKDATLTGRTKLWEAAWRQFESNSTLGFGYGVLWDEPKGRGPAAWIAHDAGFVAGHAHNGWLEVALGLGYVGLCGFALYVFLTLIRAGAAFFLSSASYFAIPTMLIFLMRTLTEVSALDYHDITWTLFVTTSALSTMRARNEQSRREGS